HRRKPGRHRPEIARGNESRRRNAARGHDLHLIDRGAGSTERSRAVTSSADVNLSLCLISSQFFASLVRTRANEPFTFSPRRRKLSFPFASPSLVRSSASARAWNQVPPSSGE